MPRNDHERWQMDLEEYIRQGEPEQSEKSTAWKTAIGLQDVDGLKTSEYLLETAKEHIEGRIDIIKTCTVEMQEKGLIRRENGKRNGRWEVLVKL